MKIGDRVKFRHCVSLDTTHEVVEVCPNGTHVKVEIDYPSPHIVKAAIRNLVKVDDHGKP